MKQGVTGVGWVGVVPNPLVELEGAQPDHLFHIIYAV